MKTSKMAGRVVAGTAVFLCAVASAVEPELPQEKPVAALLERLQCLDADVRDTADDTLYDLPPTAFPLLEAADAKGDLPPDAGARLRQSLVVQRPLQSARARNWARSRSDYVFNEESALQAYRDAGHHDPKWDDLATSAIVAFVTPSLYKLHETALAKCMKAIDQGCDDPLVLHAAATLMMQAGADERALLMFKQASEAFHVSKYPASRKVHCDVRRIDLIRRLSNERLAPEYTPLLDTALTEFADACGEQRLVDAWVYQWAGDLQAALQANGAVRKDAFDRVGRAMEKAMPKSAIPLAVQGDFLVNYAWDARGSGWGNTVTDEGWKLMAERLSAAEQALNKAWTIDPTDGHSSRTMLQVELGQNQGRVQMEKWFALAMQADPDDYQACAAKEYYLEPKWYGGEGDALAFARDCVKTRRWSSKLPLLVVHTHDDLAGNSPDQKAYCAQPAVWQDISDVLPRYLRQFPDDAIERNVYLAWAWRCGHMLIVKQQIDVLGDDVDLKPFGTRAHLAQMKHELAESFPSTRPQP